MIKLYGKKFDKKELLKHVGDISQIAEAKSYEFSDGMRKGVDAVDFRTGSGFNFTVLPRRGMDVSYAEYNGIPLSYRSCTGDVAPEFFEPEGLGWLRGFCGGLLTTCGLTYLGEPCKDGDEELGLHGRASYIPAKNICVDSKWEGNTYVMWVQGKIHEASFFGANICLTRRISAKLGGTKLRIEDIVENLGHEPIPHMFLYHINVGFPVLDENAEFISTSVNVLPRDEDAKKGVEKCMQDSRHWRLHYSKFQPPTPGFREQVFYHDMKADADNHVYVAVVNRSFNNGQGIGVYLRYHKTQFPKFIQWKMNGEGAYVVGMEPANCYVEGRAKERSQGTLQYIEAGGRRHYESEISVLTSNEQIDEVEKKIELVLNGN